MTAALLIGALSLTVILTWFGLEVYTFIRERFFSG